MRGCRRCRPQGAQHRRPAATLVLPTTPTKLMMMWQRVSSVCQQIRIAGCWHSSPELCMPSHAGQRQEACSPKQSLCAVCFTLRCLQHRGLHLKACPAWLTHCTDATCVHRSRAS